MSSKPNAKPLALSLDISPSTLGGALVQNDEAISAAESTHWTLTAVTHGGRFPFRSRTNVDPYDLDSYPFAVSTATRFHFGTPSATDDDPRMPKSANPTSPSVLVLTLQPRSMRTTKRKLNLGDGTSAEGEAGNANKLKLDDVVEDAGNKIDHATHSQPLMTLTTVSRIPHHRKSKSMTDLSNEGKRRSQKPLPPLPPSPPQSRFIEILSIPTAQYVGEYEKKAESGQGEKGWMRQSNDVHINRSSGWRPWWNFTSRRKKLHPPRTNPRSPKPDRKTISHRSPMTIWEYLDFSLYTSPALATPVSQTKLAPSIVRGRDPPFPVTTDAQTALTPELSRRGRVPQTGSNPRNVYSPSYVARMGRKF